MKIQENAQEKHGNDLVVWTITKRKDSECITEVQSKGHESNGKLIGALWLL